MINCVSRVRPKMITHFYNIVTRFLRVLLKLCSVNLEMLIID